MKRIKLNIHNYSTINIYSDIDEVIFEFEKNKYKISKTIPITEMKIEEIGYRHIGKYNSLLIFKGDNNNINYDIKENNVWVTINNTNIRVLDYIYILLEMFSNDLLNEKKYLIHSSSLKYDDNKSILLVGEGNSGKSTLACNLILNYDMKLISNDHTVIGLEDNLLKTFGGTKPLEIRYGTINKYFSNFSHLMSDISEKDLWRKKIIVNDHIDNKLIANNDKSIVTDVFQIDLCENGNAFIETKDYIDQRLFLYEHLSKQIKGTYNLITGFDYPMPSVESIENLKILNEQIKCYLNNTDVHICKGSLNEISKIMVKKLEKK